MSKTVPTQIERWSKDLNDAIDMVTDIVMRADAMGLGLVHFPVPEIKEILSAARRAQLRIANLGSRGP